MSKAPFQALAAEALQTSVTLAPRPPQVGIDRGFLLGRRVRSDASVLQPTTASRRCPGQHSPLFSSSKQPGEPRSTELTMKYLVDRGMPTRKLAVGLPLYGKGFAVSEPYASTKDLPPGAEFRGGGGYTRIAGLIKELGWTRRWDDETKNPWAIAPDGSAVIGYDDAESIGLKTEWAMKQGFRGVFFWQIGGNLMPDGRNPLQEAERQRDRRQQQIIPFELKP